MAYLILSLGTADAQWYWQNPLPQGNTLSCVSFSDADNGLAVGDNGAIIRTTDGGATWVSQQSGLTIQLLTVFHLLMEISEQQWDKW